MELKFGNLPITSARENIKRITMLLWGGSGTGKTTLAATAPGKKLLINFDPDGPASIAGRDDVLVADFSKERPAITERLKMESVNGLKKVIEDADVDTVIVDSITSYMEMSIAHVVTLLKGSSMERPSQQGYGYRNSYVTQFVLNVLKITGELGKHCIFIAHEDVPNKNEEGMVLSIEVMLGGKLKEGVPLKLSEVWALEDTGKQRRIAIRPCRMRKPMKTRMFKTSGAPEFVWNFDPETNEGDTIEDWYIAWKKGDFSKIDLPKTK